MKDLSFASIMLCQTNFLIFSCIPFQQTGKNSGKYRHPHIALAALELWIANQCMPDMCPQEWLESPNGQGYGTDDTKSTSITWCEMDNNNNLTAQPLVPYEWPNTGGGVFPGHELYGGEPLKAAPGVYVNEVVGIEFPEDSSELADTTTPTTTPNDSSAGRIAMSWFLTTAFGIAGIVAF
jgi:hypothetical protein